MCDINKILLYTYYKLYTSNLNSHRLSSNKNCRYKRLDPKASPKVLIELDNAQ